MLASALTELRQDPTWASIKELRNTLLHRESSPTAACVTTMPPCPRPPGGPGAK